MSRRRLTVRWAQSAALDLEDLASWIARDSPATARRIVQQIRTRGRNLATTPERGRVVPELAELGIRYFRESIIPPYRLIYRVERKQVIVLALIDGRRNIEEILLERLVRP